MSIGLDYLTRTKLAQKMLSLPCSVICENGEEKLVIVINSIEDKFHIKKYLISQCKETQTLPLFEEFFVEDLFSDVDKIFGECKILKYQGGNIFSYENSQNQPMSVNDYESRFNYYMNSKQHALTRDHWLWSNFLKIYRPDIVSIVKKLNSEYGPRFGIDNEKHIVEIKFPKSWAYWEIWKKQMLTFNTSIPAELVFGKLHNKTFQFNLISFEIEPLSFQF